MNIFSENTGCVFDIMRYNKGRKKYTRRSSPGKRPHGPPKEQNSQESKTELCRDSLEKLMIECRRCKANAESLRQKDRVVFRHTICFRGGGIPVMSATGGSGCTLFVFYIRPERQSTRPKEDL